LTRRELRSGCLKMPVADTEVLFLLKPSDPRHKHILKLLEELGSSIVVPDTALLEFEVVLRSRGLRVKDVRKVLHVIHLLPESYGELQLLPTR